VGTEAVERETTQSLALPEGLVPTVPFQEWAVEVVRGPDAGKRFSTLGRLVRVGTESSNDLVLSDGTVSRRHLELEWLDDGPQVRDLGSRNGTLVDGRRVLAAWLRPGDVLELGKTALAWTQQAEATQLEVLEAERFGPLVGRCEAMRIVFAALRRVARHEATVLLEGETGTGKELAARAVHGASARREGPFRVVDCPALDAAGAEAELFGPEGAFQGARGGTVFLDEVGELPAQAQPRLLRALESKVLAAPGQAPVALDVRILAATQRNLAEEVHQGRFRQDLYFRLAVVRVRLPPLRTRKADLPLLVQELTRGRPTELSERTWSLLQGHHWPGNVRELRNVLERATVGGGEGRLEFSADERALLGADDVHAALPYHEARDRLLADFEKAYFTEVLRRSDHELSRASAHTGLSVQSLYRLLKKNGLRLKDLKGLPEE
jgi:two-component system, NtrC family, response regulator GlrR